MPIEMIEEFDQGTQIKVIGVGGGGGNAVEHMIAQGVQGVDFICANTDAQALGRSAAGTLVQLGKSGLGAGSKPSVGRTAAEEAVDSIRNAIDGAHMLFITAGMGGGTGTGAAPVIARVAKEMGILTVGVVTKPFEFEGKRRCTQADHGVAELEANVDSLIVVLNEKLLEVMGEPGKAMMGTATASGPDRARIAAEQAVACPLLEGIDLSGAKGVLVLVTAARGSLKLSESRLAMSTINAYASPDAHVIYGAAYDDSLGDELRVTVVATGLSRANARRQPISVVQGGLRTGTDNMAYPMVGNGMAAGGMASGMAAPAGGADYGNMAVPSVWRTNRTQAAARVDALVSGGMDDLEIPAFLRKQAD